MSRANRSSSRSSRGSSGSFGFPRRQRLLTSAEFSRVFKRGTRSSDRYFTVIAAVGAASNNARTRGDTQDTCEAGSETGPKTGAATSMENGVPASLTKGRELRCRLGLAVSRKTARRAVDRNRIKRIVRESFRSTQAQWTDQPIDFVVVAKPPSRQEQNSALFLSLANHWQRLSSLADRACSSPRCGA
jgi:ribonuclease P protein component